MGNREAVFCLNTIIQNALDTRREVCIKVIDHKKAIDTIKLNQSTSMGEFVVLKGTHQGCFCRRYYTIYT